MKSERVTIGVPVYHGEAFLEEALRSIQAQTHCDFEVLISFDEPSTACEKICARFADDPRFQVSHRPARLGWVGNINWLLSQVRGDFWYFHQQDDVVAPEYLETLLGYAREHPQAALVYCDLLPMGRIEEPFEQQAASVRDTTPFMRMMTLLHEHFPAFAFRGLTQADALRVAGPIPENDVRNFGVDICWVTAIARAGELHRVTRPLYRKRYHESNTESGWWAWPKERRLEAWPVHCVNLLEEAMRIEASAQERRLLWLAAIERLTSKAAAAHFLNLAELTGEDRVLLFDRFLAGAFASTKMSLAKELEADWEEICIWSRGFYWIPGDGMLAIADFGPDRVRAGELFNRQPDGSSALWVTLTRSAEPGVQLRLGESTLPTVNHGRVLTANIPPALTDKPGELPLRVVGLNGRVRSEAVVLKVEPGS